MLTLKRLFCQLVTVIIFILLCSCGKLSQEKYSKIKNNMTMQEVIAILGEPTSSERVTVAGIAGTSVVWKDKNTEIDIQFLKNKVTVKSYNKNKKSEPHKKLEPNTTITNEDSA